jgi:hypothetical protein
MRLRPLLVILALVLAPAAANAQNASDEASAQKLFDEGRALVQGGRYAEACAKFAASQQLAPSGGTLLNLADCYEKNGQLASAWAKFHEVATRARRAGRADVEQMADERVKRIEPQLSFVTVVVPPDADIAGLEVRRDGEVVPRGAWGTALPIDGGTHAIQASAPKRKARTLSVEVKPSGDRASVTVPTLEVDQAPGSARSEPAPRTWTAQRIVALGVGGAGVVALGVGAGFGLKAVSKNKDAEQLCPASPRCDDPRGVTLTEDAKRAATISTISFIAGGALIAGGVVLYLTGGPTKSVAIGLGPKNFTVGGSFQ